MRREVPRASRACTHGTTSCPRAGGEAGTSLIELLVALPLAAIVLAAGLMLLRAHAMLARDLQSALLVRSTSEWAIRVAERDAALAGADPAQIGVEAIRMAGPERLELDADVDGDGAIDPRSAERLAIAWSPAGGGRVVRWVGRQAMTLADPVPRGGFRLRYFDDAGVEIGADGSELDPSARARVRLVRFDLEVRTARDRSSPGRDLRLRTASAIRLRSGEMR